MLMMVVDVFVVKDVLDDRDGVCVGYVSIDVVVDDGVKKDVSVAFKSMICVIFVYISFVPVITSWH